MNTDNTNYVARPKGKPDVTTKGRMNEWANGYKEFVPQGQKPSNRTMLKQVGGSSFYKSEGAKESSFSLHLNVDAKDCADPVAALHEQFLEEGSDGRMLFDNGGSLKVWLDSAKGEVAILTRLSCSPQIERELLQAQSQMNVTVGRYRAEIINNKKE